MEVTYGGGKAMSRLAVKREFQGWKDIVHGGVVAAILDEIMAHAVIHYAGKAVTTSLQITYRVPMHVGEEVQAEGCIVQRKSRGALAKGEIRGIGNDKVLATAESRHIFLP
jgi:uncharacterized protein (TIGR00369 family)